MTASAQASSVALLSCGHSTFKDQTGSQLYSHSIPAVTSIISMAATMYHCSSCVMADGDLGLYIACVVLCVSLVWESIVSLCCPEQFCKENSLHVCCAGKPSVVQLLNYKKNGDPFINYLSITPIYDSRGHVTHFVGIQSDISDLVNHKKAELAAKHEAAQASDATRTLPLVTRHWHALMVHTKRFQALTCTCYNHALTSAQR